MTPTHVSQTESQLERTPPESQLELQLVSQLPSQLSSHEVHPVQESQPALHHELQPESHELSHEV